MQQYDVLICTLYRAEHYFDELRRRVGVGCLDLACWLLA